MVSRKVGIIVEGPSDKLVVHALLRSMQVEPIVRVAGGAKILTAPRWMVPRMFAEGAAKVIALKDSHCHTDVDAYRSQVLKQIGRIDGLMVCVVVHAIESWLLGDMDAVGAYLGSSLKVIHNPEKYCKPDEELNHFFRSRGRSYVKRLDAPAIATRIHSDLVNQRCPSFGAFIDSIRS